MDTASLRILDANANRAREALRVMEDYARFCLNHEGLSEEFKQLRHGLAEVLKDYLAEAILHRDVRGDVGTEIKTAAEGRRETLNDVVIAAGKRLGEALRVIEEVLKTVDAAAATRVEKSRYAAYQLEQKLAQTLRPASFDHVRLYVLITESICNHPWLDAAKEAIAGGADCLQLREKSLESGELLKRAKQLVQLCRQHNILCIINDRPDIALASGADGLHVGQEDLPATEVRKIIGPRLILGVSTHNLDQAKKAVLDGADYIGIGPIFRSETKARDILPGLDFARQIAKEIQIPAVAIAGINDRNVDEVLATGIKAIAVTAAVLDCDDIRGVARRLKQRLSPIGMQASNGGAVMLIGGADIPVRHGAQPHNSGADIPVRLPPTPKTANPVGRTFLSAQTESDLQDGEVKRRRRKLPHWTLAGSTYFLTFRVAQGELTTPERSIVLDHLQSGHGTFYSLLSAIVMPDHVHLLLRPNQGMDLSRIMKGIKGVSAKKINQLRGHHSPVWQDEWFDRIVRDQNELDEKLNYMLNNSVKRDLVDDPWDYQWWYINEEELKDGGQECPPHQ